MPLSDLCRHTHVCTDNIHETYMQTHKNEDKGQEGCIIEQPWSRCGLVCCYLSCMLQGAGKKFLLLEGRN